MKVRKAVIPVAGYGTRFLPVTRSVPKPMLPIIDQPLIHFAVEEANKAGIEQIILVMSSGQEAICRYFDRMYALEHLLQRTMKNELLDRMIGIAEMADIVYIYQKQQLGLGHAVKMARDVVGREPFAVFLPDDIIWSSAPTIGDMMDIMSRYEGSVIAVKEVPDQAVPSLGIVDPRPIDDRLSEILGMVEKPRLEDAPSNLAIIGRYVLTPEVFDALDDVKPGAGGEIQLTDAIEMVRAEQGAYAYRFPGDHFDVGTPPGLLRASVYSALHREDMAGSFRSWLKTVL